MDFLHHTLRAWGTVWFQLQSQSREETGPEIPAFDSIAQCKVVITFNQGPGGRQVAAEEDRGRSHKDLSIHQHVLVAQDRQQGPHGGSGCFSEQVSLSFCIV